MSDRSGDKPWLLMPWMTTRKFRENFRRIRWQGLLILLLLVWMWLWSSGVL